MPLSLSPHSLLLVWDTGHSNTPKHCSKFVITTDMGHRTQYTAIQQDSVLCFSLLLIQDTGLTNTTRHCPKFVITTNTGHRTQQCSETPS